VGNRHLDKDEILAEWRIIQEAQKHPAAFAELYSKYFKPIYLFILRRIGNETLTEDICTNVFSKAMVKIPSYQFKGVPFSAWLYKISLHEIHAYYRYTKRERVVSMSTETLELLFRNIEDETDLSSPEDNEQKLLQALSSLSTDDMLYIEMRFFEGRSFKEIGEIQQLTENNAKVKTYRIVERLRKIILTNK
jgi:RNA polymerase sigma-70 factor, ECF subfamily